MTSSHGRICDGGAKACVRGLLGPVSRKNGWQLAEYAGWRRPDGQQHLLDRARWDVDELRDRVRRYALDGLADSAGGVLVIDESGFAKKGQTSVGVARQFTGSLGGVFPCQIGVFAAWATTRGATPVDREIYLPTAYGLRTASGARPRGCPRPSGSPPSPASPRK